MPPFLRLVPLPKSLTSDLPKPVAAGIGLAVSLPGLAVQTAMSLPSTVLGTTAKIVGRYEELAELGTALVAGRGARRDPDDIDEFADYPTIQGWGDAGRGLHAVDEEPTADSEADSEADDEASPLDDEPDDLAKAAEDRLAEPASSPDQRALAVDDYASLSVAALRSKVGALTVGELEDLRDYEQGHGKRLTVLQLLERTIAKKQA